MADKKKYIRGIPDPILQSMIWIWSRPRTPEQGRMYQREMLNELEKLPEMRHLIWNELVLGKKQETVEKKIGRKLDEWDESSGSNNHDPLDEVFDWRRLPDIGLGWEASNVVLNLWAYDQKLSADRDRQHPGNDINIPATMRKALWWWKVHCATGEFKEDQIDLLEIGRVQFVWSAAEVFWLADWYESRLGIPQDTSGNWAYLAYKPWRNAERRDEYERALDENRIGPSLNVAYRTDGSGNIVALELMPKFGDVYRKGVPDNFEEMDPRDAAEWAMEQIVMDQREMPDEWLGTLEAYNQLEELEELED